MLTQVETTSKSTAKYLPLWSKTWLVATTRPSLTTYQDLLQSESVSLRRAALWLLLSGATGGTLNTLGSLLTQSPHNQYFDTGLLIAIPTLALLVTFYWAIFAGCSHLGARVLKGKGTYERLGYIFATFSAPLLIVVSLLSLIPQINLLLLVLYLYWFGLYVLGVQAAHHISRLKAFLVVLLTFVVLSCTFLGTMLLAGYIGRYVL